MFLANAGVGIFDKTLVAPRRRERWTSWWLPLHISLSMGVLAAVIFHIYIVEAYRRRRGLLNMRRPHAGPRGLSREHLSLLRFRRQECISAQTEVHPPLDLIVPPDLASLLCTQSKL